MAQCKTVAEWMAERGITLPELIKTTALDDRVVEAIARGRYTPSPEQRRRLAAALGVALEQVAWGHVAQVEHVYGHGPQFGRSP
jgi:ribosome-binding protein aMBF1 (putative translation factor)